MRLVGDPEPGPQIEKGVRYYEGEPDAPDGQWVRVMQFEGGESRQAFYNHVAAKVEEWNREKPGHRLPEMVTRTISPWTTETDCEQIVAEAIDHSQFKLDVYELETATAAVIEALDSAGLLRGGGRGE